MMKSVVFLAVFCLAYTQARYTFKCPDIKSDVQFDIRDIKGTWYAVGVNPSRWSMCYNYTVKEGDASHSLQADVTEQWFRSVIHTKVQKDWTLTTEVGSPVITFTHKLFWVFNSKETWTVTSINENFMVLYNCGLFKEQSQIWVRTSDKISADLQQQIESELKKINFATSDYQWRTAKDCNH